MRPELELSWKNSQISISGSYGFEAAGARGFGDRDSEGAPVVARSFGENTYFKHNPTLLLSGSLNDTFGFRMLADLVFKTHNGQQSDNASELALEPMISAKINPNLSILVGYQLFRVDNMDAATGRGATIESGRSFFKEDVMTIQSINQAIIDGTAGLVGKASNRHVGKVEVDAKLTDTVKVTAYAWAGRRIFTQGTDLYTYRINADLKLAPAKDLNLSLRYRYNIDDKDATKDNLTNYHLGRVIASYSLTEVLSLNLENEAVFNQAVVGKSAWTYENENYLGLSYKF